MINEIIEIKNIIPKSQANYIETIMTGFDFPWAFNKNIVSGDKCFVDDIDNPAGLNHFFYEQNSFKSTFFDMVYPIILNLQDKINDKDMSRLIRMRANLILKNSAINEDAFMPHIDSFFKHIVAIYYVNDSDGDTIIFNETNENYDPGSKDIEKISSRNFTVKKRIKPEKGKILVFPGNYYHTASFCKKNKFRCVINTNLSNILI